MSRSAPSISDQLRSYLKTVEIPLEMMVEARENLGHVRESSCATLLPETLDERVDCLLVRAMNDNEVFDMSSVAS